MNYYEHHLGDYDGATAHLSWLEDCAYRRLICLYYRNEQPIPGDLRQACRLVRATSKQEREAVEQVLAEFFTLIDGAWHHKRCDADLSRYQAKSQKARESVSKRWAKRDANEMPTNIEGNTNVSTNEYERNTGEVRRQYTARPSPDTRHQTPDINTGRAATSEAAAPAPIDTQGHAPTLAGRVCRAMKSAQLQAVNPGDPRLLALLAQGATIEEFTGLAEEAVSKGKGFAWVLSVLAARREDAARIKLAPAADESSEPWHQQGRKAVEAKAAEHGIEPWNECEQWLIYLRRVRETVDAKEAA